MTPSPESSGSSSCRAMLPPQRRWYWSARRIIRALVIGSPSSEKPMAPASRSSTISVSSSPFMPLVTVARKPTGTEAPARACSRRALDVGGGRDRRLGVGHREDPTEAARRGRAGSRLDVLFVLVAGGAQVHVRVEEGREGVQALGLDQLGAVGRRRARRRQLGDLAVADDDVVDAVDPGDRVEYGGAAQDQMRGLARAHVERLGQAHAEVPIGVGLAGLPSPSAGEAGRSAPASSS